MNRAEIIGYRDGDPVYDLTELFVDAHPRATALVAMESCRRITVAVWKLSTPRAVNTYDRLGRRRPVTCTHEVEGMYLSSPADGTDRDFACIRCSDTELLTKTEAKKLLKHKFLHDGLSPDF